MRKILPFSLVFLFSFLFQHLSAQDGKVEFINESELHEKTVQEKSLRLTPLDPDPYHVTYSLNSGLATPQVLETNCTNSDFNEGTWRDWDPCYGPFANPCSTPGLKEPPAAHPLHMMINSSWMDAQACGQLPTLFPGQAHVARIGDTSYNGTAHQFPKASTIKYTVHVGANSYLFVYRYAVVLQSGGHGSTEQPDFKVTITDSLGNQLGGSCGYYYVSAPTNGPPPAGSGWHQCGGSVYWKEWTTVGMDLTPYLGQNVTLRFDVRGCTYDTHYGYAYISAYCGYLELQTALCEGDTSATLTAPPGFQYLWSTSNGDTSVNGDTTQSIVVPNPTTGSSYKCHLTAVNGCTVDINTILTYTVIHTGFVENVNCANRPTHFMDTTWVNQNAVTGWRWFFGDPTSGASDSARGTPNPSHIYNSPGTYTVTLISYSTEGCADTMTKTITVGLLPTFTSTPLVITRCSNEPLNYQLHSNLPGTWFNWRAIPKVTGITGYTSNNIVHNPDSTLTDILVNHNATIDTVIYRIVPVTDGCTGDSVDLKVAVKPLPDLRNTVFLYTQCDSTLFDIQLTSTPPSTLFTWTCTTFNGNATGWANNTTTPGTQITQLLRNLGNTTDTVYYHITGHALGCDGPEYIIKVAVYPLAQLITTPLSTITCNGVPISIPLIPNVASTLFSWTVTQNGTTGGTNSGSPTTVLNQTLSNAGVNPATAVYLITPRANGCNGRRQNYIVTVNPTPQAQANPASVTICSGVPFSINLSCPTSGTSYSYTATPSSNKILGYSNGTINPIAQTLTDTSAVNQTVTYTITPTANGCVGPNISALVTVKPLPDVYFNPAAPAICSGATTNVGLFSHVANTTFNWTAVPSVPTITGYGPGTSTTTIAQTLTTLNIGPETVTYTVSGTSNSCTGSNYPVIVTINPSPQLTMAPLMQTICSGTATNIPLTSTCPSATYSWSTSVLSGSITGNTAGSGTGSIAQVLTNALNTQGSVNYRITGTAGTCSGVFKDFRVFVDPTPTLGNSPATAEICSGTSPNVLLTSSVLNTQFTWTVTTSSGNLLGASNNSTLTTSLNQTLTNTGTVMETATYHITPHANGCDGPVADFVVTVHPVPVPTLTGNTFLCTGTTGVVYTTQSGKTNYVWSVSAGGTITAGGTSTSNTVTVTWNTPGAKTISIGYSDPFGCPSATPFVLPVTVNPLPVPTITGNQSVCKGTTGVVYTTEAGRANYIWNVSAGGTITAGGTSTDNTVTVTWNTAGAQTVSVNYQDANTCTAVSATVLNVTVNALPVPSIAGPTPLCRLSTGAVYTTQAGKTNYSWSISAGGTITAGGAAGDNTATVTWNNSGAQSISVNYFDANGCTAVAPVVYPVNIHVLPVPVISGPAAICSNANGTYTTAAGMTNYTWTVSAGGTITSGAGTNTIVIHWTTIGSQTVTVNYKDANGCFAEFPTSYTVNVNDLPVPTLTGLSSICEGNTTTYTTDGGLSGYVWTVSAGGTITAGGTSTDNTVTVHWTTAGSRSVSVNYTVATGCTAGSPTTLNVTVFSRPIPALAGNQSVCSTTTGVVYTTDPGKTNYVWTVSPGGTITAGGGATNNTVTVTWNTPGAQTVTVNYTDANSCDAYTPTSLNVTVHPLPAPTVAGNIELCSGTTGMVYTTQSGQFNYQWNISAGGTITSGGTGTSNTVTITWTTPGAQTVSVNYVDNHGCTAAAPFVLPVTVDPLPVPTITGLGSICEGNTTTYTTEAGLSNYTWVVSAGGTITSGGTTSDNTITIHWTTAGARTVSVNYSLATSCRAATATVKNVTVFSRPVPALTGSQSVCATATNVVYTSDPGKTNYVWTISPGGTITAGGGATDNTVTVTWNTAGTQTVTVNFTDANNCDAYTPTSLSVTVHPLPVPTVAGTIELCAGTTGLIYTSQPGQFNYQWNVSSGGTVTSGGTGTSSSVTVNWNTPGAQSVSVNYVDMYGCTAPAPFVLPVTVNPLPVPTISGNNFLCTGSTGVVYTTQPGFLNYIWNVSAGGVVTAGGNPGSNTVTVNWTNPGPQTVSVNYTDSKSCTAPAPYVFNVTVNPLPVPTLSGTSVVCAGTTGMVYTTQAGKNNYSWTVSAGGTITAGGTPADNTVTVTWTTAGAQTVTVNYFDANICTAVSPASFPVTVNPLPVPLISGPVAVCLNATGTYSTAPGMTGYTWTVSPDGNIVSGSGTNSIQVIWNTNGPKTITVNYLDANLCTAATPTSYSVNVNTLPVPSLAGQNSICTGFSATYTTDAGMSGYTWSVSPGGTITSGGTSTSNTATILWTGVGNMTVTVNYTMGTGCTAPAPSVYNVTVHPLPTPSISGSNVLCAGPNPIVYTTQPGMTNYQWTVTGGTVVGNLTSQTVTVQWLTPGNKTLSVNYNDPNTCTALAPVTYNVTVNPLPVPALSGPASICLNATGTYSTDGGMSNYQWTVSPGGTIISGSGTSAINVLWSSTGTKTITVNYNDPNTCTAPTPTTYSITVNPLPAPTIKGINSICTGLTAVYRTEKQMTNYSWSVTAGGTIIAGGSSNDSTITVLWNTFGFNTVSVNYYIPVTNCTAAAPTVYPVTVKQRPSIVNAVTTSSICSGLSNNFVLQPDLFGTTYSWTATGSSAFVTGQSSSPGGLSVISQTLTNTGINIENVTYAVTPSLNGCDGSVVNFITTVFPVANVSFTPAAQSFCTGGTTGITLSSLVQNTSFTWTATGTSGNVNGFSNGAGQLIQQTLNNTGTLIEGVNYQVTPVANSCTGTINNIIVNVYPNPSVTYVPCSEILTTTAAKPFTLRGGSPLGGTYSGTGVSGGLFNPAFAGPGTHMITYSFANTWGCSGNSAQSITVITDIPHTCGMPVTDIRDNQQYPTVQIGSQCWMSANFNYGSPVAAAGNMQRDNCTAEKYCYGDNPGNCSTAGGLYQWDEMMHYDHLVTNQGICPPAWHVPSDAEFTTLVNNFTGYGFAGDPLKSTGFSGFNALFYGLRFDNAMWDLNNFATFFWTSTPRGAYKAWGHAINTLDPSVASHPANRSNAYHLRCVKD